MKNFVYKKSSSMFLKSFINVIIRILVFLKEVNYVIKINVKLKYFENLYNGFFMRIKEWFNI